MDGTPVYDVKPYLPYVDSHPEARGGFTDQHDWKELQVNMPQELAHIFTEGDLKVLEKTLALDPRPHYHDDSRQYAMPFGGYDIRFHVEGGVLTIDDWIKL